MAWGNNSAAMFQIQGAPSPRMACRAACSKRRRAASQEELAGVLGAHRLELPRDHRARGGDAAVALEPVGRGASMGALGRIYPNGDLDLALTIRTFAVAEGLLHLWVGGGIVWDSDPHGEVEESWVKARPLLAAIGAPLPVPVP